MNIEKVFEELSFDRLQEYVDEKQEEHLYLDFKLVKDASLASTDDKRNLARALSGFANSSGGVIVWGVEARKNSDGVDAAVGLKEIRNIAVLLTRLNELSGDGVDPTVPGVLHRIIKTSSENGFAVSLIPESLTGPHMGKLGEDRYYKRSGDSFYKMEHFDIADMFSRRRKPKLTVTFRVVSKGREASIVIGLRNEGRATARSPYLALDCDPPFIRSEFGLNGNGTEGMPFLRLPSNGYRWCYAGGIDTALHPGMAREIACLNLGRLRTSVPLSDAVVRYAIACEDQPLQEDTFVIKLNELV